MTLQRPTKRIYTTDALEAWFASLPEDWEARFEESALIKAREIYRSGISAEIELVGQDAIVSFQFERRRESYAVITLQGDEFTYRASTKDAWDEQWLAAAALYEIEELVADEVMDLPPERRKRMASEDETDSHAGSEGAPSTDTSGSAAAIREENQSFRKIKVMVRLRDKDLICSGFWIGEKGGLKPVFGDGLGQESTPRNDAEREQIIRLTSLAMRAGFQFVRETGLFVMTDPGKMVLFGSRSVSEWERHFVVELDKQAQPLTHGIQRLNIDGRASEKQRKGLKIDWEIRVGGQRIREASVQQLARRKSGLHVIPSLGALEISEQQVEGLNLWKITGKQGETVLPKYMLFSLFGQRPIHLTLQKGLEVWIDQIRNARLQEVDAPAFLREYQRYGVAWLKTITDLGCHPLLADDMGLGKTVQVLALLCLSETKRGNQRHPDIIVCPASVVPVWEQELSRWFPGKTSRILGRQGFQIEKGEVAPDLWLCSYTQLRRNRAALDEYNFRYAILDEAQYIKNPDAKVSQACYAIRADHRIAMTGTPVENRTEDLWALFRYLMPGLLGSRRDFRLKLESDERFEYVERLRQQIQPFILRRTRDVVAPDLPPKMEIELACPLTPAQKSEYAKLSAEGIEELGESWDSVKSRGAHFFTLLTRLRQVCCDPALLPGGDFNLENSGKVEVLVRHVMEAMETGRKVVIFSQFVKLLSNVRAALKGRDSKLKIWSLTGQTVDRAKPVDQFQKTPGPGVILVSLRAGGTGITLHAADTVFLMDPWWNPAVEAQAVDRIHRLGQDKTVFVYRMVAVGTIEEKIERLKSEKRRLFEEVIPDGKSTKGWTDAFSDLKSLVELSDVLP